MEKPKTRKHHVEPVTSKVYDKEKWMVFIPSGEGDTSDGEDAGDMFLTNSLDAALDKFARNHGTGWPPRLFRVTEYEPEVRKVASLVLKTTNLK